MYASPSSSPTITQHSLPGNALPFYPGRTFTGWTTPASPGALKTASKDKAGKPLGEEIYSEAEANILNLVEYMWTRPGETELVQKTAYVTKIDDQICAVGYYKQ